MIFFIWMFFFKFKVLFRWKGFGFATPTWYILTVMVPLKYNGFFFISSLLLTNVNLGGPFLFVFTRLNDLLLFKYGLIPSYLRKNMFFSMFLCFFYLVCMKNPSTFAPALR